MRLINVTKKYGEITAIKNININVRNKEYLCIIGPSGCGKTTLIKCIAGIIEPDEGEIYIDNKLMNNVPIQDRGVGYVFQEIALFPHMTVYENVSYGPFVKGLSISSVKNIINELIDMMKLQDRVKDHPNALSGGAQQKTAIARALSSGSRLLLFDEPLGSLDVKVRKVLRYELRRLVKDLGLTAIHVTHDQEEAMSIADRIVVMRSGEIVEVGTPLELYLRPKTLFTANFVGEANFFVGELIDIDERGNVKVDVNGKVFFSSCKLDSETKKIVVAIRPEFIVMGRKTSKAKNSWKGVIEEKIFLGSSFHFKVSTDNDVTLVVKVPLSSEAVNWRIGDHVNLILPTRYLLLYPYPKEGLERAIALETFR